MISIIIPAKNESQYIERCLDSLSKAIKNHKKNIEFILVDNDSTDDTSNIAKFYGCQILKIREKTIGGLRNIGVQHSKGNIIAFLDADCCVDPLWIEKCLEYLSQDNVGLVGTITISDIENGTWVEKNLPKIFTEKSRLDYPEWIGSSNMFIKRHIFEAIGGFDEQMVTAEDVEFCRRVRNDYKIRLIKEIYTIHLKESKSLVELFAREFWRGRYSLTCYFKNKFPISELLSIVVPFFNLFLLIVFCLSFFFKPSLIFLPLIIFLFLPLCFMIKKKFKFDDFLTTSQSYFIALTYILSRTFALCCEIFTILKKSLDKMSIIFYERILKNGIQ